MTLMEKAFILTGFSLAGVFTVLAIYFLLIKVLGRMFKN
jgi:hypothetical protein